MNHPLSPARRGSGDGEDAHALTGPYAVDALDADERAIVERHLEGCAACREEVRELRETAARLAATAAVPPPDRLRARVLAEIGTVRQAPPQPAPSPPPSPSASPPGATPLARRTHRFTGTGTGLPWLAAAAMFVAAVVLGALLADARSEGGDDALADRIAAVVSAPDTRVSTLPAVVPGNAPGDIRATVLASRSLDSAVVLAAGLPRPDKAHVYQVWFMTDDSVRAAGLLGETAGGDGSSRLVADHLGDAARVGVTLEPAGGSPVPTTPPVVLMTLSG